MFSFISRKLRSKNRFTVYGLRFAVSVVVSIPAAVSASERNWIVELEPIAPRYIQLPDVGQVGSTRWFGDNFQTKLIRKLIQKNIRVRLAERENVSIDSNALRVSIDIDELSFVVGRRGERMHFGFSRGAENPFNAGLDVANRNEFPLVREPGWFGTTFRDYGKLRTGLEIGHEINFEVLLAGARVKQLPYIARFGTEVLFHANGHLSREAISAKTTGFYFDVSAHFGYGGGDYLAALKWARSDALLRAFDRAVDSSVEAIVQKVRALAATELRSSHVDELPRSPTVSSVSTLRSEQLIDAGTQNFPMTSQVAKHRDGFWRRLWLSIKGTATLPYRIWRYYQYDQSYLGAEAGWIDLARATRIVNSDKQRFWMHHKLGLPAAWKKHGLGNRRTIVAVIDSGMDYNHSELNRNLYWDGVRDSAGWDFLSWDSRAFDDHTHGTEVASVVGGGWSKLVGVAPSVTLLPIKAFSPYGQTSSGALLAAFEYAIAAGAKIIVCGWATPVPSRALRDAVLAAQAAGVLVVAAAGDDQQNHDEKPHYPAAFSKNFDNVVSVAAYGVRTIPRTDIHENVLWYDDRAKRGSGYGTRSVDLAAPGDRIPVARPRGRSAVQSHSGLAAGVVAGVAALSWSICPKLKPHDFKALLLASSPSDPELDWQVLDSKVLLGNVIFDLINQHCNSE